ncbi:hypothetical protein AG1IA_09751 [Rhizoctonia solani AG-1 IA]|uniref:Uncharacterized protein n=1 Tax=Thanatephorus cucumeris (strain AG1-IA) TaxID=983506 RepID=L8WIP4_THACA|nr:hypothetical protein AG1IA_09751 [Rhizoctonia solani AG-1 IA]
MYPTSTFFSAVSFTPNADDHASLDSGCFSRLRWVFKYVIRRGCPDCARVGCSSRSGPNPTNQPPVHPTTNQPVRDH